jgi:hypothetical protein
MIKIDYPKHNFRLRKEDNKEFIFDEIRKRWIILTPEEWVRQNFIQFLIQVKQYPSVLIAIEKEIKLGELKKRCDIIVYKNDVPWMIVECKEMNVTVNEKTFNQELLVEYLITTNGSITYGIETATKKIIEQIPNY